MNLLQWTCARTCLIFLIIASLGGCGKTESENVKSKGVHAEIDLIAQGDGYSKIRVRLQVGESGLLRTDLELSSGDRLIAYAKGLSQELSKSTGIFGDIFDFLFGISYVTTLPFDDDGALFQVAFERSDGFDAPNSRVTLPDAFSITTADDLVYTDSDLVVVNWEPFNSPEKMSIEYRFDCEDVNFNSLVGSYTLLAPDSGQLDMPVAEILTRGGQSAMADFTNGCDLEITLVRKRKGTIDPNYGEGGHIYAQQRRMIEARIAAPP